MKDVRTVLQKNAFTTLLDLKDAYWQVPIHPYFHRFLGFSVGKKKNCVSCLPFGLNIVPRVFTKLAKAILRELRQKEIHVVSYPDNWLIWEFSEEKCHKAT